MIRECTLFGLWKEHSLNTVNPFVWKSYKACFFLQTFFKIDTLPTRIDSKRLAEPCEATWVKGPEKDLHMVISCHSTAARVIGGSLGHWWPPSYDKIAAYRRQISIFSLSITGFMVGGWSLSQLPLGWRWGTPCTCQRQTCRPKFSALFFFVKKFHQMFKYHVNISQL